MELLLQQTNILIHLNVFAKRLGMHRDVLLPHGFDESNLGESLLKARHESERGGGFTNMLFGGGDEDWTGFLDA
jgi:hypothetical protein